MFIHKLAGKNVCPSKIDSVGFLPMGRVKKINDKRHRIMNAAITSFAQRGYHQATIADVAREAGVAAGTIYLYFKNKDDLLVSIFEEKVQGFIQSPEKGLFNGAQVEILAKQPLLLPLFDDLTNEVKINLEICFGIGAHEVTTLAEFELKNCRKIRMILHLEEMKVDKLS